MYSGYLHAKIVDNKWLYRIKRKLSGTIGRYKAKLIAKGFIQEEGVRLHEDI